MDVAFEKMTLSDRKIIGKEILLLSCFSWFPRLAHPVSGTVGIDFGTTFSGIAWAETKLPDRRDFITTWPVSDKMLEGESSGKVPTKMRYDSTGKMQWGFAIPITADLEEVVQWFKL